MSHTIEGRLALITGAGHGLGAALAAAFASRGARVIATDLDEEAAAARAGSLADQGYWCRSRRLDVTRPADVREVAASVQDEHGPVSILINNAGIVWGGPFSEVPLEKHLQTYRVNTEGVVSVTHSFLPQLVASGRGSLVNIASASSFIGLPWGTTYASSKWAVAGFSESIRLELAEQGHHHVKVTAVCPAYIETDLFRGARPPRLTSPLAPERVAGQVVRAVERGKRRLLTPTLTKLGPLNVALPARLADGLGRLLGVHGSMKRWQGRSSADDQRPGE